MNSERSDHPIRDTLIGLALAFFVIFMFGVLASIRELWFLWHAN